MKEREGKKGKEQGQRFDQWVSEDRRGDKRVENLHRDLLKVREGKRGKEHEQRSEQQVSEDRWGDGERRTYLGIS